MSDTPRTDAVRGFFDMETAVPAEEMEKLERELSAALARIKRLEEASGLALGYASKGDFEAADAVLAQAKESK